jgi:hypothetical protein
MLVMCAEQGNNYAAVKKTHIHWLDIYKGKQHKQKQGLSFLHENHSMDCKTEWEGR